MVLFFSLWTGALCLAVKPRGLKVFQGCPLWH